MNDARDRSNLDHMLELAKYGAERHNERRQVEFRIFVAYITILALIFYQVIKPKDAILQKQGDLVLSIALMMFLLVIHGVYFWWKRNFFIASINDVRRRDFYLLKTECLSYHLSQNSYTIFYPSDTKRVWLNLAGGESEEMSERHLFKKENGPRIITEPTWKEFWALRKDAHIWFQVVVPTLMLLGIITVIFKEYLSNLIKIIASVDLSL